MRAILAARREAITWRRTYLADTPPGNELGLFTEKKEFTHRKSQFDNLSDLELVQLVHDEAQALLEDHSGGDGEHRT